MHPLWAKISKRVVDQGPRRAARTLLEDVATRVFDPHREIILMELDLAHPKAHPQPGAPPAPFVVEDLTDAHYPSLIEMLEASEPWRIGAMASRRAAKIPGFVAIEQGRVVGYMFYTIGDAPGPPHPDLEWLGMSVGPGEVYTFDAFIPVALRGRGLAMFRLAYQALHQRGFRRAKGYVYTTVVAALFTYRTMGWVERGRIFEHRIAGRWVVVDRVLYRLNRFDRTRLAPLPIPDVVAEWVRSRRAARASAPPGRRPR